MTETSILWATNGTGDGTGSGYTADNMFQLFRALFGGVTGTDLSGVAGDYLNGLAVAGSSSPLTVATGAALVYGVPYFNSASASVTVPTPASATRIDRIVLRASWSAQTVRITRVAGTEGAGAPSLTQSQGVTWDMPLARVGITTGGVITITDEREYLRALGDGGVSTAKIANSAVTTAKIADSAITTAKLEDLSVTMDKIHTGNVTTAKLDDLAVTAAKMAADAVTTAKILDANVTTAKVADDAVTNAKLANMAQATIKGRAISVGTGDPVDLTAGQLVQILATADGAASGLDADLLDGNHAAAFATAAHSHGTSEIADSSVTNTKLATQADASIKGRAVGAGTGVVTDLTAAQVVAIVATADGTGSGLDADTVDGSHASAFAAAVHTHGTSGLDDGAVTNTKMANMAANTIKGRAAGSGAPSDLSASQVASIVNSSNVAAWGNLSLSSASASTNNTPQYRTVGDEFQLRGSIRIPSAIPTLIATLPSSLPGSRYMYVRMQLGDAYLYLTGNSLYIYSGTTGTDYSLEGVRFSTSS